MTNQPRKKVMLLITKSNWGGAQRYVYDMATNLPSDEFEVTVALGGNGPLIEKLTHAGIRTIGIPGLQRDISLSKELRSSQAIARIIRKERPDILHVNSSKAGFIGAVLGRALRVPKVIFTAHGWAFNEDRGVLSRSLMGFFHWLTIICAHHTITVSNALRSQMKWPGTQSKMITIYNGGHVPNFLTKEEARSTLCTNYPFLQTYIKDYWSVTIGELHKTKQHHIAIQAIGSLIKKGYPIRHVIISEGEERTSLEALVTKEGLNNNVFFTGHLDSASRFLAAFDLFILASRSEALGYVVLEAAQARLPIVASNVGGIPEIVTDGHQATLVTHTDIPGFAQAIEYYYTHPLEAAAHAQAAYKKSKTFSIDTMIAQTIALYQS